MKNPILFYGLISLTAFPLFGEPIKDTLIKQFREGNEDNFVFSCVPDVKKVKILASGQIKVKTSKKNEAVFRLSMPAKNKVEKLFCYEGAGMFVIAYAETDGENSGTHITKYSERTMKPLWSFELNGLGFSGAGIDQEGFYYAASNTVGKLDLATGNSLWTESVSGWFEPTHIGKTSITFNSTMDSNKKVTFDRATGKRSSR